jgi:hypothetical protein
LRKIHGVSEIPFRSYRQARGLSGIEENN